MHSPHPTALLMPPDPVASAYDHWAPAYDHTFIDRRCRAEDQLLAARLRRFLAEVDDRVLDLGCGTGAFLRLTGWHADRYLGVDVSTGMLDQARAAHPDATFMQATIEALPLPAQRFAAAVSLFSPLSYVTAPLTALREIHRILRPGGRCLLMVYGPRWYGDGPQRAGGIDVQLAPAAWSCWQARERCDIAGFTAIRLAAFSVLPTPLLALEGPLTRWLPGWGRYLIIEARRS